MQAALSTNLKDLANIRNAPFATKLTAVTVATVSEEEAARNKAADEAQRLARKEARESARQEAARRQQEALSRQSQPKPVIPPTAESKKLVESYNQRKSGTPVMHEIPKEILAKGLADDKLRDEERQNSELVAKREEEAWQERLRVGYIADVRATALDILRSEKVLEEKILLLEQMGCTYSSNAPNGRDAIYFHARSGAMITVYRGGLGQGEYKRHKPRGVELLKPEEIAKRQALNEQAREAGRTKRMAAKAPKVKTPKKDKDGDKKKSKRGGDRDK